MASPQIRARRSQLISTYGVGSLFPAENSSYLIMGLHHWDTAEMVSVPEPRLARQLRVRELKAPPATPDDRNRPSVPVWLFPSILVCPACDALGTTQQLRSRRTETRCGVCGEKRDLIPSRFVTACKGGHLADFPYFEWAHSRSPDPQWWRTSYPEGDPRKAPESAHVLRLESRGRTSALSDLLVVCSCGASNDLEYAFSPQGMKHYRCTGERPWLGFEYTERDCAHSRVTVQRGASNVWFGASASAISIPSHAEKLDALVRSEFSTLRHIPRASLEAAVQENHDVTLEILLQKHSSDYSVAALARQAIFALYPDEAPPQSEEEFRLDEFRAIVHGSEDSPGRQFVSVPAPVPEEHSSWITEVRRVTRLREVRALHGFSRLVAPEREAEQGDEDNVAIAPLRPDDDPSSWLPAVELLGEGLFLAIDQAVIAEWANTSFARSRTALLERNAHVTRREGAVVGDIDITRLALHSLAHSLIDQLALDAGYPASSLQERLYVGPEMAGVLVYTASSDSAGSLGGVAAMADPDRLGSAISEAEARLSWCSADPVCIESTGSGVAGSNLAACHNCILLPETSCEHFNTGLDRGTVFGTPEEPYAGLIAFARARAETVAQPSAAPQGTPPPALITDKGWGDLWSSHPEFRSLIEILAEEDAVLPVRDSTIGDAAVRSELVWPEAKIMVTVSDVDTASDDSDGWTVYTVDEWDPGELADHILDELES